ncbi:MAG: hypothetical protein FJX54_05120 [Alphaproteobacteria bacterium]|nr:hypothetical protein [Alphaproteobacteria bacterium]
MTDKSLDLLEEAKRHRRKAAEMRGQAMTQPKMADIFEDLARVHDAAAEEIEDRLSPGLTKKD